MIYEINHSDIEYALKSGCHCICVSVDGRYCLISSTDENINITTLNEYLHTDINEVLMDEKWRTVCKECG